MSPLACILPCPYSSNLGNLGLLCSQREGLVTLLVWGNPLTMGFASLFA